MAQIVKASAIIEKAKQALSEKWGYIWGAYGQVHTQKAQNNATRAQTKQWGQQWVGKHVLDCSGLFYWSYKLLGGYMYHGSNTMWKKYTVAKGELKKGVRDDGLPMKPGCAVFLNKSGNRHHVGMYIGNGRVIEAQGTRSGVVESSVRSWDEWGELKDTEYDLQDDGTLAPTVPIISSTVWTRTLKHTSPLMSGEDVRQLQIALNNLGYDCGEADGVFGAKTKRGVKQFQNDHALVVDGIFGPMSISALSLLFSPDNKSEKNESDVEPDKVYTVKGFIPDVSVYQGNIDMDAFCAGNDFAIFRARVNGKPDTKFDQWASEMQKRGFPFAVYDYLRLKSDEDAVVQADAMYEACSKYDPRIYYLDTENPADGVTYEMERGFIKTYVARLREHGVKVIGQYAGDSRWRNYYRQIVDVFDTIWIAHWGKNEGTYTGWTIKSEQYTDKIDLHQFTSYGYEKVPGAPGINHRIDLNRLTGKRPLSWFTGRTYE